MMQILIASLAMIKALAALFLLLMPVSAQAFDLDACRFTTGFQMSRYFVNDDGDWQKDGNLVGSVGYHCQLIDFDTISFEAGPSLGAVYDSEIFESGRKTAGIDFGLELIRFDFNRIGWDKQFDFIFTITPHFVIPSKLYWNELRYNDQYGVAISGGIPLNQILGILE